MVYISKVYTRSGDGGRTHLVDGSEVAKSALRVHAYGEVDELNATLGLLRLELGREQAPNSEADAWRRAQDEMLARIQQELFNLGGEFASPVPGDGALLVGHAHVERLEHEIDALNEGLEPLRSFILPGGGPAGSMTHLARTVCRRAERTAVTLSEAESIREAGPRYLNRLSDLLFVFGRACAHHFGHDEVLWVPSAGGTAPAEDT
jgi:cob(I)alamin adenosyltransferase